MIIAYHVALDANPGGRPPPPPIFAKYFKKSPKFAKSPQNPRRPPFYRSWIRHWFFIIDMNIEANEGLFHDNFAHRPTELMMSRF